MVTRFEKQTLGVLVLLVLIVLAIWAGALLLKANKLADYSDHATIAKVIFDDLSAISSGQPYPPSLSDLRLEYGEGGDASLLNRFDYQSNGASCTVSTVLGGEKIERSFPAEHHP